MGYTWAQFTAYRALAQKRKAAAARDQFVLLRTAFAGGNAAAKLHRDLAADAGGDR